MDKLQGSNLKRLLEENMMPYYLIISILKESSNLHRMIYLGIRLTFSDSEWPYLSRVVDRERQVS